MRKFNYEDNDDYREDVDKFFGEDQDVSDEEYKALMEQDQAIQQLQMQFVYRDLNHRSLRIAVRMCEKSFWWWFFSHDTKLKMIAKTYKHLRKLEEE